MCLDEILCFYFILMFEYFENEYLVLDINYENLIFFIVFLNGVCYLFNISSFGGMNIKNIFMLYLNCWIEIGGLCELVNKISSICGINLVGNI